LPDASGLVGVLREDADSPAFPDEVSRLDFVLSHAPVVFWAIDAQGLFTVSEGRGLERLGLRPGEVVGKSLFDLYGDAADIVDRVRRALTGEDGVFFAKVAGLTWEVSLTPLRDGNGTVIGVAGIATDVTARQEIEQELHNLAERWRALADTWPGFVLLLDTDAAATIRFMNAPVLTLDGEHEVGNSFYDLLPEDQRGEARRALARVRETREVQHFQVRYVGHDGEIRHLHLHVGPVFVEGRLVAVSACGRDVTEHVERETLLRASKEELSSILNSLQDTYFRLDEAGHITRISPSVLHLLGYDAESLIGKSMRDLYAVPRQHGVLLRKLKRRGGVVDQHESRLRRADGREIWVSTNAHYVFDGHGLPIGVEGTARNVTEQKHMKDALRRNERLLEKAQAVGHMGSWEWDIGSGRVVWSNETYRIFGVRRDAFKPTFKSCMDRIHSDDRADVHRAIRSAVAAGETLAVDYRIVRPESQVRHVRVQAEVSRDAAGKALRMVGVIHDITDSWREEEQLIEIARGVSAKTGERFFQSLVWHFARVIGADYALVADLVPGQGSARTIAVLADGAIKNNFAFRLEGTPAAQAVRDQVCAIAADVRLLYPQDAMLAESCAQAYIGQLLVDSDDEPIGLLAVVYRQPLHDVGRISHTLKIFAARAAAELERLRIENALAKATREWTQAMDAFEDAIYIVDTDDRLVRANQAFFKLVGRTRQSALGQTIAHLLHPDLPPDQCAVCSARREHRDTYITVESHDVNNPRGHPYEVQVRTLRDATGKPVGALMARHDLTRTREAADALRRANDHLRLVLGSTAEGIFGVDRALHCTFANYAAAAMLGSSADALRGRDMTPMVQAQGAGVHSPSMGLLQRTIIEGCSFRAEEDTFWRQDGRAIGVQYTANPIIEDGQVTGAVVVFRSVDETRAMKQRLDYLATHDTLTGLINRYEFERRLDELIERSRRDGQQHVLCYLDLDQFKVVNDTCGHVAGDQLLHQLSGLLQQRLRPHDTLARLGGDEFGMLFERCTLDEAQVILERMRETVREFRFAWQDKRFALGVSIGIVAITATTVDRGTVLSQADSACYMAKERGRNRVHVHQDDDADLARHHGEMQWIARIQHALETGHFQLYRQPIRAVGVGASVGLNYEILLRMGAEGDAVIPPGAFLPAAERYSLVSAIDRWVVENVLRWLSREPAELAALSFCTINLSGQTLGDEKFLAFLTAALKDRGALARKLCFELTETAAVTNLARTARFFRELKQLGCRFALDDFGSGMSSFAYLKSLPVDFLKIDGEFVKDIARDPVDFAMVEAINQVGHVMGLQTIAEFVETEAVFSRLRNIGVDYAQGYALGRPQALVGGGMLQ
jgi:diguanylate cyclase (GGDEF)-like protein/PAS domain S-box-containing protein